MCDKLSVNKRIELAPNQAIWHQPLLSPSVNDDGAAVDRAELRNLGRLHRQIYVGVGSWPCENSKANRAGSLYEL
jgi:hypothetical protein